MYAFQQTLYLVALHFRTCLLAELPDVDNFKNAKQYAAFAGVTPAHFESGTSIKGKSHISRIGSKKIRKSLYMAAIVYTDPRK